MSTLQMLNRTHKAQSGRCHYGRKCCASMPDMMGGKRKRRMLRRIERNQWRKEAQGY